jgi:hypothetical protein
MQYFIKTGTGAQPMSWTFATSEDWGAVSVGFKEVARTSAQGPVYKGSSHRRRAV